MNKDLTVKDVVDTMSDAQKNTLCLYMRSAYGLGKIKSKPPYASIDSLCGTIMRLVKEVSDGNQN